jgi:WD40 repeat protein
MPSRLASASELRVFLSQWGLEELVSKFIDAGFIGPKLWSIQADDLADLGVSKNLRADVLRAIAEASKSDEAERFAIWMPMLAVPYASYASKEVEANPRLRLWDGCEIAEMSLRLIAVVGIARLRQIHQGVLRSKLSDNIRNLVSTPMMGQWYRIAELTCAALSREDKSLADLLAPLLAKIRFHFDHPKEAKESVSLNRLRNMLAHGGISEAYARTLLENWRPRFEEILKLAEPLATLPLLARSADGGVVRVIGRDGRTMPQADVPAEAVGDRAGSVAVRLADQVVPLGPFVLRGVPHVGEESPRGDREVPQVFLRHQEIVLEYLTVGSEDAAFGHGEATDRELFDKLFQPVTAYSSGLTIQEFDHDLKRDAAQFIGRVRELDCLRVAVENCASKGLFWISGPAGIGKSYLMARVAVDLVEEVERKQSELSTLILPFRFRAGDDRCYGARLLMFLRERLLEEYVAPLPDEEQAKARATISGLDDFNAVSRILSKSSDLLRTVILLDGLDELERNDPNFPPRQLRALIEAGGIWVCAGRSEGRFEVLMREFKAIRPLDGEELKPMQADDIREMIAAKIGPKIGKLIAKDEDSEDGKRATNRFIEAVVRKAKGLPLYVRFVIGEVLKNHLRRLNEDDAESLPDSLDQYFETQVKRYLLGDAFVQAAYVACALSLQEEVLSVATLAALLNRWGIVRGSEQEAADKIRKALAQLGFMAAESSTPDGETGYRLYHSSLRDHLLKTHELEDTRENIRTLLADAARNPGADAAAHYLYRSGIRHLIDTGRVSEAADLLSDFNYLMERLICLADEGQKAVLAIIADWRHIDLGSNEEDVQLSTEQREGRRFFRKRAHLLLKSTDRWPAHRILVQLAIEYRIGSKISHDAEASARTHSSEPFLMHGPVGFMEAADSSVAVLSRHAGLIYGALVLPDGRLLSWSQDKTLRLWEADGTPIEPPLIGHTGWVSGALALPDGRVLSWSEEDCTLRLWEADGAPIEPPLIGHRRSVYGALALPDGRLLSWSFDETLRLWRADGTPIEPPLWGHEGGVSGALILQNGRLLSWSPNGNLGYGTLRLWESDGSPIWPPLEEHANMVIGASELPDGRLLSWSHDGTLRLWEADGTAIEPLLIGHTHRVNGALALPDGRLLSWSDDHTLRLWESDGAPIEPPLTGHSYPVHHARVLPDGRILSLSQGEGLRLWQSDGTPIEPLLKHTMVSGALILPEGKILSWSWHGDSALRFWQIDGRPNKPLLGHGSYVNGAMRLADGRLLSWSNDKTLRLWELEGGAIGPELTRHEREVNGLLILPDGRLLSWSYDCTLLWEADGTPVEPPLTGHAMFVTGALVLPNGRLLSWSDEETIRLWEADGTAVEPPLVGHRGPVLGAMVLRDGRLLSWSRDCTLRLWMADGTPIEPPLQGHRSTVEGAVELPDGRFLSWSSDSTLRLWEANGTPIEPPLWIPHRDCEGKIVAVGTINGMLVLTDGRLLSWSDDGTLQFSRLDGTPIGPPLTGHKGMVSGALILPDGRVASWCGTKFYYRRSFFETDPEPNETALRLWQLDGTQISVPLLEHTEEVNGLMLLPDRRRLLSWSRDGRLCLWSIDRNNEVLLSVYFFGTAVTACTLRDEKSVFVGLGTGHVVIVSIDESELTEPGLGTPSKEDSSTSRHISEMREAASALTRREKP